MLINRAGKMKENNMLDNFASASMAACGCSFLEESAVFDASGIRTIIIKQY